MKAFLRALDHHWFAPASLRDLGILRAVVVAGQLIILLGSRGLAYQHMLAAHDARPFQPIATLRFALMSFGTELRPTLGMLDTLWLLALISGVLATIGLFTKPSFIVFTYANTVLIAHGYSYGKAHHREAVLVIALWALVFAPIGKGFAVDVLRARFRNVPRLGTVRPTAGADASIFARWPMRLIQWLLVLTYFQAGWSKLAYAGLPWFNGHTLAFYASTNGAMVPSLGGEWLGRVLGSNPVLGSVLSAAVVIWEVTFVCALIPRLSRLYIAAGVALHLGIFVTLSPPFFQNLLLYVAFIELLRTRRTSDSTAAPGIT